MREDILFVNLDFDESFKSYSGTKRHHLEKVYISKGTLNSKHSVFCLSYFAGLLTDFPNIYIDAAIKKEQYEKCSSKELTTEEAIKIYWELILSHKDAASFVIELQAKAFAAGIRKGRDKIKAETRKLFGIVNY